MASWFPLLLSSALLVSASANAVLDEKRTLIRHEQKRLKQDDAHEALVSPAGVLVEASKHEHSLDASSSLPGPVKSMLKSQNEDKEKDLCDEAYLYGLAGSNDCGTTAPIEREELCTDAATVLGLTRGKPKEGKPFEVDSRYYDVYPRGCFKKDTDDTLWFNPFGAMPANPGSDSKPVCHRPRYFLGTNDTNDEGCTEADAYHRILNEDDCRTFAECKGHCAPPEFRVGVEASKPSKDERPAGSGPEGYDNRPKGCFINPDDKCVYFNVPKEGGADPASPKGTPVCKIAAHGTEAPGTGVADATTPAGDGGGDAAGSS